MLEQILGTNTLQMEQKITMDNATLMRLFALGASIILLFFFTKKYLN